jgi:hypothetical protein
MCWNKKTRWNLSTMLMLVVSLSVAVDRARANVICGEPVNLGSTVNSEFEEWGPSISADGLSLYFSSRRPGGLGLSDIWKSMRATTQDEWEAPEHLGETVNTAAEDGSPSVSTDGLELYFTSNRSGGSGGNDLWVTKRVTTDAPWGTPANLGPIVNTSSSDRSPSISSDGLELYFNSGTNWDVWMTRRAIKDEPWGPPVNLGPTVNSNDPEGYPGISADGLTLLFGSVRSVGYGQPDIWITMRPTTDSPWKEPMNLGAPVNTSSWESEPTLSHDGSTLYFTSDPAGGVGDWDIWKAPIYPDVDFTGDERVDIEDLILLIEHWGQSNPAYDMGPTPWGDGVIDAADLEVLMRHWGQDANFIAHWKLDETGGDIAYDSAGENHAAVMGNAIWQPGKGQVNGALQFDGASTYLNTPFILDPVKQPCSVFAWIKGGQSGQTIMSQQGGFGAWLSLDSAGALATGLAFPMPAVTSNVAITDDQWHRVGLVSDGSGMSLYVDDVEVARTPTSPILPANGDLQIGAGKNLEPGSFWEGLIDDVRVYDRVVVP